MQLDRFKVPHGGKGFSLRKMPTDDTGGIKDKDEGKQRLKESVGKLTELQDVLYAHDRYAILLIFQAMDAAGKDGTIKHVMSGVNPQGCQVFSFKSPSAEELDHDFMWRSMRRLPERGRIGIFNRSYYEEVLVVRVHPELLQGQKLPDECLEDIWEKRYGDINAVEQYLVNNGVIPIKFFLHVSPKEQLERFLGRLDDPSKNWKFSHADVKERACWDDYMKAYEDMLRNTSTKHAPWYVIPADHKWFSRVAVIQVILERLGALKLRYPQVTEEQQTMLKEVREKLMAGA